ncbi:MAG: hypothetical protein ACXWV5_11300 [Flavitalea sp.]
MAEELTNELEGQQEEIDFDLENELLLIKMNAELGGQVYFPEKDEIPSEVKFELLQSVYEFEEAYFSSIHAVIPVYQRLGEPYYLPETCLTDQGIHIEFERIKKVMTDKQIIFEHEFDYEPRRLYTFITNELFNERMEDISIPGYYKHFIYEDFHPNIGEDLKRQSKKFMDEITGKCVDELYNGLNFRIHSKNGMINGEEACKKIRDFYDSFDTIELKKMENFEVRVEEKTATVSFDLSLCASILFNENIVLEGRSVLGFSNVMQDLWLIDSISLPGLVI